MIVLSGAGWILNARYGALTKSGSPRFDSIKSLYSKLQLEGIFSYPVKNFGRFDRISQITCCVAALALADCGIRYSKDHKTDMGVIGANITGHLNPMRDYFKDYIDAGRKLGRGGLFVSAMPSSAVSEASIHFGCQGPVFYIGAAEKHIPMLLRTAASIVSENKNKGMLCVFAEEDRGICFILQDKKHAQFKTSLNLSNAVKAAETSLTLAELLDKIWSRKTDSNL